VPPTANPPTRLTARLRNAFHAIAPKTLAEIAHTALKPLLRMRFARDAFASGPRYDLGTCLATISLRILPRSGQEETERRSVQTDTWTQRIEDSRIIDYVLSAVCLANLKARDIMGYTTLVLL